MRRHHYHSPVRRGVYSLARLSIGSVVAAAGFLFGPFMGQLWRIGHERGEKEDKGT